MVRQFTATLVADTRCSLGESPFWDESAGEVVWLDVDAGSLFRYNDGGWVTSSDLPRETSFAAHADDAGIVAAHPAGIDHMTTGGDQRQIAPTWLDSSQARTNDGAVDPVGRIWVGSTTRARDPGSGRIGAVVDGTWMERFTGLTLPNGMGWSSTGDTMHYVDTLSGTLWRADFEPTSANVGPSHASFRMDPQDGLLDGLCVDVFDGVWVAIWGAGKVVRIDERATIAATVAVDTSAVTSCAFVGTSLFITSANPDGLGSLGVGGLYAVDVGVEGVPIPPAATSGVLGAVAHPLDNERG